MADEPPLGWEKDRNVWVCGELGNGLLRMMMEQEMELIKMKQVEPKKPLAPAAPPSIQGETSLEGFPDTERSMDATPSHSAYGGSALDAKPRSFEPVLQQGRLRVPGAAVTPGRAPLQLEAEVAAEGLQGLAVADSACDGNIEDAAQFKDADELDDPYVLQASEVTGQETPAVPVVGMRGKKLVFTDDSGFVVGLQHRGGRISRVDPDSALAAKLNSSRRSQLKAAHESVEAVDGGEDADQCEQDDEVEAAEPAVVDQAKGEHEEEGEE